MSQWTNEIAQRYDEQWGDLPLLDQIADWLPLAGSERLIDIGCGSGAVLTGIAKRFPQCKLFGCDPMPYMVNKAQQRLPNADIQQATAHDFVVQNIEVALAANSIRHWQNVEQGLQNIATQGARTIILVDDLAFNPSASEFCPAITAALAWFGEASWQVEIAKNQAFEQSIIIAKLKP